MAGAGAIIETLLPAYLAESSEPVVRSIWAAMLALSGDAFVANEHLAQAFLAAGRRAEAEQICSRLHGSKQEGDLRVRRLALEETIARVLYEASDFKTALPHYRQLPALAPDRADAVRRVAACQRELKDYDGCIKTLADLKDPEPLLEEIAAQLLALPSDDRRKTLDPALRTATGRLLEGLAGKDDERKAALEAVRRLGRKILPALIAELEEGPKFAFATLEAGAVVTGIPNDPATNSDLKAKAASWRAWMEK
jgi:tetratricopeptide (TPR) repeat protein